MVKYRRSIKSKPASVPVSLVSIALVLLALSAGCAASDAKPPLISGVSVTDLTGTSAVVTWATDEPATAQLEYGTASAYGRSSSLDTSLVTSHTVNLSGLEPDTTYHFRVRSKDKAGNEAVSEDDTFSTVDTAPPKISGVTVLAFTQSSATVTWKTDEPATSQAEYGKTIDYGSTTSVKEGLVTSHTVSMTGLEPDTAYHFRARSADANGNEAVSADSNLTTLAPPDTAAPILSDLSITDITSATATIVWTTNEPATSQVEYGLIGSYGSTTPLDAYLVAGHSVSLGGLAAGTTYHCRIISGDAAGNVVTSDDQAFMTAGADADLVITIGPTMPQTSIKPLLGVNAGPYPQVPSFADLTVAYQQIGVNMVRTHDFWGPLDMAVMYPDRTRDPTDPTSYNFEASDAVFAAILAGGFEPYFRLGDSWNDVTPPTPSERANWVQAAVEVIRHFREGQWDGFQSDFRYVEIWNEPDYSRLWPRPFSEFLPLFAETAVALKAAFPELQVGGPGWTELTFRTTEGQAYLESFLDYMQGQQVPLDFLSWHMYSGDPDDFLAASAFYRDMLNSRGYHATTIHVSEWSTYIVVNEERPSGLELGTVGAQTASMMTGVWIAMQDQGVDVSTFYRGTDGTFNDDTGFGMFYHDGRPKRIALAFCLWSQLAVHSERLNIQVVPVDSSTEVPLWIIAGQNAEGEIALLIANPNNTSAVWSLQFADGSDPADYTTTIGEVGDACEDIWTFTPWGPVVESSAYTVQLMVLKPAQMGGSAEGQLQEGACRQPGVPAVAGAAGLCIVIIAAFTITIPARSIHRRGRW